MGRVEGEVVVAEGKPLLKVPLTLEAALCSPPSLSLCVRRFHSHLWMLVPFDLSVCGFCVWSDMQQPPLKEQHLLSN